MLRSWDKSGGCGEYWPGGVLHVGGASPICGLCMERGKAGADTHLSISKRWTGDRERTKRGRDREVLSTVAAAAGGLARSSAEAPVMGVKRRG